MIRPADFLARGVALIKHDFRLYIRIAGRPFSPPKPVGTVADPAMV
ncbi:hypothetical protein D1AOALGA4SA_4245 [Olavius algarvensis Delta 1 endosymbiont]|nr:hypothetical protein D1AOALGA4SA_4245 [Olavius algarvensis Delta 1 endosymbiont]